MFFQLVALGPRGYAKDRFNLFDGFIVLSSIVELIVSPPDILTGASGGSTGGGLSALRSFRVFRIFKLARCGGVSGRAEGGGDGEVSALACFRCSAWMFFAWCMHYFFWRWEAVILAALM